MGYGDIKRVTTGRGRKYVWTDEAGVEHTVASVTTILGALPKGGLEWWGFKLGLAAATDLYQRAGQYQPNNVTLDDLYDAAKQTDHAPHRALKAAGNRGTDVHEVAETLLKTGKLADLPAGTEAGEGYVDALVKWHADHGVASWEIVGVETRLFSKQHLYAGTTDFIAIKPDGTYVVGDHKTSKAVYESHTLQAAAYAHAAVEMGLIPSDATIETHVIRLGEDGSYEVAIGQHGIEDFLKVKAVHDLLKDKAKKPVKA